MAAREVSVRIDVRFYPDGSGDWSVTSSDADGQMHWCDDGVRPTPAGVVAEALATAKDELVHFAKGGAARPNAF